MGTVEKWPGDRWRARWRAPDGKTKSKVFDTKRAATEHVTSKEHKKLAGEYVDPSAGRVTVAEYWPTWSERQQWRDSSRQVAASYFANHVKPKLGSRRLNSLRRGDIESFGARLTIAPRTARQVVQYLSSMLDAAVADGLLTSNPARGAKRPRPTSQPIVPFTTEETDALRACAPDWFRVAFDLGLGAGLRQSEATGLSVDRVDFLRRQLTVDRQLVSPLAGDVSFGPPKTRRSYRTVPLADSVVAALARHIEVHGTGQDGLLLHSPDGEPLRRQRFGAIWRKLRTEAGKVDDTGDRSAEQVAADLERSRRIQAARFHDTRHTYASTLLSGGVSVAAAAEYLGDTPAVLLETYAHLMPGDHDRARSVVEAAFERDAARGHRAVEASG